MTFASVNDVETAIAIHTQVTGSRPLGWYTGRTRSHTRQLVVEEGGFLYDADLKTSLKTHKAFHKTVLSLQESLLYQSATT